MIKNFFLAVLFLSAGVFLGLSIAAKQQLGIVPSQEVTSKAIIGTLQTVTGVVVSVEGKTMDIENEGDRLTLKSAAELFINDSKSKTTLAKEDELKAVVGQHSPPSIKSSPDFSSIEVGRKIVAQMKKNKEGGFVVFSVDYQD